jgi:hypothetical protein
VEDVRGEHGRGLGTQELPPGCIGAPLRRRRDVQGPEYSADRGCADPVAELEQFALDPLVPPAAVLGGEPLDQRGDPGADRRPSHPRADPLSCHQAAMPPQDGAGGNEPVRPQLPWREPQRSKNRSVGPVEPGLRIDAAQDGNFVPQHQQLDVFRGRRAAEQDKPAAEPNEDEIQQAKGHG